MSLFTVIKRMLLNYRINRSNVSKLEYLRSIGCKIGDKTRFIGPPSLGSEPFLVEIGENCLISNNVSFHTHDGGVKVLNGLDCFNGVQMDKMARIRIGNNCFIGSGSRIMGGGNYWG